MEGRANQRGFTLIELLVVIAVIALLIGILVPSLNSVRQKAYRVKCSTNLRNMAYCDNQYGLEYGVVSRDSGGTVPSVFYLLTTAQRINLTVGTATAGFESQYAAAYARIKWLNCPSFPRSDQPVCFVVNGFDPRNIGSELAYLPVKRISRPSETANFTEANANIPTDSFDVYDIWQLGHIQPNVSTPVTGGSAFGRISSDDRHEKRINMSFYDGHVDSKLIKDVTIRDFAN